MDEYEWTGQSLAEVVARWKYHRQRVKDAPGDTLTQAHYAVRELYPLRDYDRSRTAGRLTPRQWDSISRSMRRDGWRDDDPAWLAIGQDGCVVVAEGNHRLVMALALGVPLAPVYFKYERNACRPRVRGISRLPTLLA